jgi:hypothetical protein
MPHERYPSFYYVDGDSEKDYYLDAGWLFVGYNKGSVLECSSASDPIGCFLSNLGAANQTEDVIRNWASQIREKLYDRMSKMHGDTHEKKVISALLLYVDAIVELSHYNNIRWHPFLKGSKRYENFIYALAEAEEVLGRAVNALRAGMKKLEQPQDIDFFQSGINSIQSEIRYVKEEKEKKENLREEENKDGCFIATAAYGTPYALELQILRRFRNEHLMKNAFGRLFVNVYYRVSPTIASFIGRHEITKSLTRTILIEPLLLFIKNLCFVKRSEKVTIKDGKYERTRRT